MFGPILKSHGFIGLRSIRYLQEIHSIDHVISNDIDQDATELIKKNMEHNQIPNEKYSIRNEDARYLLYSLAHEAKGPNGNLSNNITIIDIDPYGSAHNYIDGAMDAVIDGGLLAVTCTDLAVLCGNYPESCFSKYGSIPLKRVDYHHEMAIRILLGTLARSAASHRRKITPIVSFYSDFYVRVFIRVDKVKKNSFSIPSDIGHIHQCTKCNTFQTLPFSKTNSDKFEPLTLSSIDTTCSQCASPTKMGGPLWLSPTFDPMFINRALDELSKPEAKDLYGSRSRMLAIFQNLSDELGDVPLFYNLSSLCNTAKLLTPKLAAFRSALQKLGYRVSISHTDPDAIKTDAPNDVLWDVIRGWHKVAPAKMENLSPTSPAYAILSKEPKLEVDFTVSQQPVVIDALSGRKVKRFGKVPNSGPSSKAKRKYVSVISLCFVSINPIFRNFDAQFVKDINRKYGTMKNSVPTKLYPKSVLQICVKKWFRM